MSENQKKQLETQLWNIANELRGNMTPDSRIEWTIRMSATLIFSISMPLVINNKCQKGRQPL